MTEEEFRSGKGPAFGDATVKASEANKSSITVDLNLAIHNKGLVHLFSHFKKMQNDCAAYVADHEGGNAHRRDSDFIYNMIQALDGPEQRAIEAEIEQPFDYVKEAHVTLSNEFHGELVGKSAFSFALHSAIEALQNLDRVKKAFFYGRASVGNTSGDAEVCDGLLHVLSHNTGLHEDQAANYIHGVLGLATEAGELLEGLRDVIRGKTLDLVNVKEEVGDAKWYMAILSLVAGFEWGEDERVNIAKLRARFPDKFKAFDANNRNLDVERGILEGE